MSQLDTMTDTRASRIGRLIKRLMLSRRLWMQRTLNDRRAIQRMVENAEKQGRSA